MHCHENYSIMCDCDTFNFPCSLLLEQSMENMPLLRSHRGEAVERARDQKEVQATMNKYELALVVDAKIEEDVRVATVEKAKDYVRISINMK